MTRRVVEALVPAWAARYGLVDTRSGAWSALVERLGRRIEAGDTVTVLGITTGTHESGVAVVRASLANGVEWVANFEEERRTRRRHDHRFPDHALADAVRLFETHGVDPADVEVVGSWDYARFAVEWAVHVAEGLPGNLAGVLRPADAWVDVGAITSAPRRIAHALGRPRGALVGVRHHDCHAALSYGLSPFAQDADPTLVLVLDGMGDDGSGTAYLSEGGALRRVWESPGFVDSLGLLYQVISAGQGGWTPLASEGRFMGAAAWGDRNRSTNVVYQRLRRLLVLGDAGSVHVDRAAANWHNDPRRPYAGHLLDTLGDPIPVGQRWDPDAVLDPDRVQHRELTRCRLDQAAALQCLFEDAVVHVVDHLIRTTGARRLVWTGGTALNCVAGLHVMERFEPMGLRMWVPPVPSDTGVAAGAAWLAIDRSGRRLAREPLRHAFLGGAAPIAESIRAALLGAPNVAFEEVGPNTARVADLTAFLVSKGAILGLFHGAAETGPRALGHRSIIADPTRPDSLERINARVKRRERVRPLAPMCTAAAAERLFELHPGAAPGAYAFMVLCARARPEAREAVPAVVHRDGTARIQIVDPDVDPFTHAILEAMGRHVGVEVAINTSLNVGAPIAHTASDAVETLRRARGMHGLILRGDDGTSFLAWETTTGAGKDGGVELGAWLAEWGGR